MKKQKKPDETITATTQVQEQEQPTFQATSSVTHPEQTTEVIISIQSEKRKLFPNLLATNYSSGNSNC
jgi:hypothetical protein